jgi:hypothetical protein
MKQRPVAIGLLVCEQVVIEEGTRNATLVNCFTHRRVKEIPSPPIPFVVLALLTDGIGEISLEMKIQRLDTLEVIARSQGSVQFPDPLREVRFHLRFRDCSFPVAGIYDVVLLAEGEPIASRRIVIHLE